MESDPRNDRDEVFSRRVPAGKRTYFFDVKATRSGEDFFLVITESKRSGDGYRKHKIFLYKEDFGKFVNGFHDAIEFVREELLPDYEFEDLPDELAFGDEEYDDEDEYDDYEEDEDDKEDGDEAEPTAETYSPEELAEEDLDDEDLDDDERA